jgi:hypothetical protein
VAHHRHFPQDLLDDPGALVATGERIGFHRHVPGGEVIIGVTQPGGDHFNEQLVLAWRIDVKVDDLEFSGSFPNDCTSASHVYPNVVAGTG